MDLFSGIGGITLALKKWVKPIAYCEQDKYAQAVLMSSMQNGDIPHAPIWDDVRTLSSKQIDVPIDIIYGGFPCQDISTAGNGKGLDGERSGLFFEIMRLSKEIEPKFIFLENVPAIRTRGLDKVTKELALAGYDCRWDFVSAEEMGAPHYRNRWFLLAYTNSKFSRHSGKNKEEWEMDKPKADIKLDGIPREMANTMRKRWDKDAISSRFTQKHNTIKGRGSWEVEPNICRVADGIPFRMDRIKGLGNAVVPAQAEEAFKRLMGIE